ncbi:DUF4382 domain-containing protein [Galbibacter sp. EGI 63066]|uniref:DUF4382 domain-containing protein n=1 Tax=Galbibacter sp. EGI 63066 TaxID=2993559 RepID=UPI00224909B0|nr:DUF4382 domain-containing protein [Galbibacter sp. EGI 63066]MCX2680913.1 DUF4382 domain-containing protein [Galbibacter sp. EGI 63066]
MKNRVLNLKLAVLAIAVLFMSCSKDDDSGAGTEEEAYNTEVAITDAPIDNANIQAAVVTITGVEVNGNAVEGFTATTVDLMTLQNGTTELLGNIDLKAQENASVSLILDYESDVDGDAPGCYVETVDGTKHALVAASNKIDIAQKVEVFASTANKIIVDFDLRKTIIAAAEAGDEFDFATDAELSSGLRLVNEVEAGKISGNVNDSQNTSETIVAYAYEAGTYTEAEAEGQGASNVTFANAVTSAKINNTTGAYELNFLKEGDYEVHFASYSDTDADGKLEFNGELQVESATGIDLSMIEITSQINLSLNVTVVGFVGQ